jgi:hypothetical protein
MHTDGFQTGTPTPTPYPLHKRTLPSAPWTTALLIFPSTAASACSEGGDPSWALRSGRWGHHFFRVIIGSMFIQLDLPVEGLFAEGQGQRTGLGNFLAKVRVSSASRSAEPPYSLTETLSFLRRDRATGQSISRAFFERPGKGTWGCGVKRPMHAPRSGEAGFPEATASHRKPPAGSRPPWPCPAPGRSPAGKGRGWPPSFPCRHQIPRGRKPRPLRASPRGRGRKRIPNFGPEDDHPDLLIGFDALQQIDHFGHQSLGQGIPFLRPVEGDESDSVFELGFNIL